MAKLRARFPFELVITVGDNIYGGERPQDMKSKFEDPYKALLDGGVKFYASLGNHDDRGQSRYQLFNMEGRTYYTFKAPKQDVRFFALETDYLTPPQVAWLEKELVNAGEDWKIPYFHHPLYSSGKSHGSHPDLAAVLEPLFLKGGVSVVFAGHDHFYERIKPQKGIVYFVAGSGGKLRRGDIDRKSGLTAVGLDTDPRVPRRRDRRRRALLQRDLTPGRRHRLRRHSATEAGVGTRPVPSAQSDFEHRLNLLGRPAVGDDDPDFPPAVELQLAQALTPDERGAAVTDDRADVQPKAASLRVSTAASPLSALPMMRISTPALCRSSSVRSTMRSDTLTS